MACRFILIEIVLSSFERIESRWSHCNHGPAGRRLSVKSKAYVDRPQAGRCKIQDSFRHHHLWIACACFGVTTYVQNTCLPFFAATSPSTPPGYSLRVNSRYCSFPGKKKNASPLFPAVIEGN